MYDNYMITYSAYAHAGGDYPGVAFRRDYLPVSVRPYGGPLPRTPPPQHRLHQGARCAQHVARLLAGGCDQGTPSGADSKEICIIEQLPEAAKNGQNRPVVL